MNSKKLALLISIFLLALTGCAEQSVEPTPTPQVVRVAITPAARYTRLAVSTCAATIPGTQFEIHEVYPSQADADLLIRLGEPHPAAAFAAQIATEDLVIILHPDNPASSLSIDEVVQLFSGAIQNWSELGGANAEVQVWSLLPADETRDAFSQDVLEGTPFATTANLAPTPELMVSSIAGNPNAVGFLPVSWATANLTGILPGVSMPVLVTADAEPQGASRELVACLQGEIGQELLGAFFSE